MILKGGLIYDVTNTTNMGEVVNIGCRRYHIWNRLKHRGGTVLKTEAAEMTIPMLVLYYKSLDKSDPRRGTIEAAMATIRGKWDNETKQKRRREAKKKCRTLGRRLLEARIRFGSEILAGKTLSPR